uniref:Ribonuclease A-domain domain-containing protein n=1 Tax=Amphilophus citrinellus TaxID=61819 RepID=A0A3Q0SYH8_AMPCI
PELLQLKISEFLFWDVFPFFLLQEINPSENRPEKGRYEEFKRQHINPDMTVENCDEVIRKWKIYKDNVRSISNGRGDGDVTSTSVFNIVDCKLQSGDVKPNCNYKGTFYGKKRIMVRCEGGLPVHYYKITSSSQQQN